MNLILHYHSDLEILGQNNIMDADKVYFSIELKLLLKHFSHIGLLYFNFMCITEHLVWASVELDCGVRFDVVSFKAITNHNLAFKK